MTTLTDETHVQAKPDERQRNRALQVAVVERFLCPQCEGVIPVPCARRRPATREDVLSGRFFYEAYCPHCNVGFAATFTLGGGVLVPAGCERMSADAMAELSDSYAKWCGDHSRDPTLDEERAYVAERRRSVEQQLQELRRRLEHLSGEANRLARQEASLTRRPPDPLPRTASPVSSAAHLERTPVEQTLDPTTSQLTEAELMALTEPGRDYEPN